MRDNNDIAPFKNILNEMYSKDISKKVHSSYPVSYTHLDVYKRQGWCIVKCRIIYCL